MLRISHANGTHTAGFVEASTDVCLGSSHTGIAVSAAKTAIADSCHTFGHTAAMRSKGGDSGILPAIL